jgi:outer membrane protein assembly factor BamE (lipoprotein component of BamABCDE complex)
LQKKIVDLQNTKQSEQVANQNTQKQELWRIKENWRKLQIGLSMDEVRLLLGEPVKVNSISIGVYWYYAYCVSSCSASDSHVFFRRNTPFGNADPILRVSSWNE